MAIANSSSTQNRRNSRWSSSFFAAALVFAIAGCNSLEKRHAGGTLGPVTTTGSTESPHTSVPETAQPTTPVAVPGPGATPAPPVQQAPTFLSKELPKVGVILGPGGMKAYAEIGVLREFARARIPIHAVVGLEWGAVIGGLYSVQGQANDAEWKSFKLKESDLPSAGFLSRARPQSIAGLAEFLDTAFGNAQIEKSKVEFACPAYWSKQDRFGLMTKGGMKEAMNACLPYPPLFAPNAGVVAAPLSIAESVSWLRAHGANVIVLVDVISAGDSMPAKLGGEDSNQNLLWSEMKREMVRGKTLVNHVITVNTAGHPLNDFNGRRILMENGSKSANDVISKMASQYGF